MAQRRSKTAKTVKAAGGKSARVLIVEARFYDDIADKLLDGAKTALEDAGATFDVVTVPGALEIPGTIAMAFEGAKRRKKPYDAAVALGCVIQGETYHFEVVSNESARGLMDLTVRHGIPIGNGILTVDTDVQAHERATVHQGNKGGEAARAALAVLAIKKAAG